jgi:cytochrome c oxidase cbb3-type subunit 3
MRFGLFLLASSLLVLTAGCKSKSDSLDPPDAAGGLPAQGQAITANPVGPIPGALNNIPYETNPLAGNLVAMQDGRRLFNWYNCSGCHGGHGGGGMGPSLRDPVWLFGDHDGQIFDSIAHGRSDGMPAWGAKIPPKQIWELVAYIKSMNTPDEPDPPTEPADEEVPNPEHFDSTAPGTPIYITASDNSSNNNGTSAGNSASKKTSGNNGSSK